MRKASFIWPWEKSVKKILITSLQSTTVFVWNRTIWGCSMTIHSLLQWEGKSGSKKVGLMPSIVINAFIKMRLIKSRPIGGRYGRVCNLYVCPLRLASLINQSINQSIVFFLLPLRTKSIHHDIRFENRPSETKWLCSLQTWIWDQGMKWQSVINKEMQ